MPIKKELDNGASIKSKIKLFDKFRFMSRSLSNLFDWISEGVDNDNMFINYVPYLGYMSAKDDHLIFRWFECQKIVQKVLIKKLVWKYIRIL